MLTALRDDIIVKKHKLHKTQSKILLIDTSWDAIDSPEICEVVSVGRDYKQVYKDGKSLKEGDYIICEHIEGIKVVYDSAEYWRMKAYNVLAKVDKEYISKVGTYSPSVSDIAWEKGKEHFRQKGHKID